jgi:DNA-binding transcriptional regulator YiaG
MTLLLSIHRSSREIPVPNFNAVFKSEVTRLARKEVRALTQATKKAAAQHRREIAALKRQVSDLLKRTGFLEGQEKQRLLKAPAKSAADGVRFSPKWAKSHRAKLGISAADYGRLVGVSGLTIYNWESGKSRPREKQIAKWAAIRGLGKREAMKRLDMIA